jgi:hypothetical protein
MLIALRRFAPAVPGILVVLVLAIVVSAAFDLRGHGVAVVGSLPSAFPDSTVPDVSGRDLADLLPTAFGVMLLCTRASASRAGSPRATAMAEVRVPALEILSRSGLAGRLTIAPTIDAAVAAGPHHPPG